MLIHPGNLDNNKKRIDANERNTAVNAVTWLLRNALHETCGCVFKFNCKLVGKQ